MPISEQEQSEIDAEFEAELDEYMTEWTDSLREKWGLKPLAKTEPKQGG